MKVAVCLMFMVDAEEQKTCLELRLNVPKHVTFHLQLTVHQWKLKCASCPESMDVAELLIPLWVLSWLVVNHRKFVWSLILVSWEMNLGMVLKGDLNIYVQCGPSMMLQGKTTLWKYFTWKDPWNLNLKLLRGLFLSHHSTIYSVTTFLKKCRQVVWEIWFTFFRLEKSGWPEKKNPTLQNHFSWTNFLRFSRKVIAD